MLKFQGSNNIFGGIIRSNPRKRRIIRIALKWLAEWKSVFLLLACIFLLNLFFLHGEMSPTVVDNEIVIPPKLVRFLHSEGSYPSPTPGRGRYRDIDRLCPSANCIFFVETSMRGYISQRQTCGVEAALRFNRGVQILVLIAVSNPEDPKFSEDDPIFVLQREYPNTFKVIFFRPDEIFLGSPLGEWYLSIFRSKLTPTAVHMSDGIRMILMYYFGGIYMDLDMINIRNLTDVPDGFSREFTRAGQSQIFSNAFLKFGHRRHSFPLDWMSESHRTPYKRDCHDCNAQPVIQKVVFDWCGSDKYYSQKSALCRKNLMGDIIQVHDACAFCPINWINWKRMLSDQPEDADTVLNSCKDSDQKTWAIHLWNDDTSTGKQIKTNSAFGQITSFACPKAAAKFLTKVDQEDTKLFEAGRPRNDDKAQQGQHPNPDVLPPPPEKETSKEKPAKDNEQPAKGNEQPAKDNDNTQNGNDKSQPGNDGSNKEYNLANMPVT